MQKQRLEINKWVNLLDRYKYGFPKTGLGGIYYFRNTVDGKGYIGLTVNLQDRLTSHISNIKNSNTGKFATKEYKDDHKLLDFHEAMWQFELSEIEFCILYYASWDVYESRIEMNKDLSEKEIYFIEKYNTQNHGYNMCKGGISGIREFSETSRNRVSIANHNKANNGDNIVYAYDTLTKERMWFMTKVCFYNYIGAKFNGYSLSKYKLISNRYLADRDVDSLEDKIIQYYKQCTIRGEYIGNNYPKDEIIIDMFKGYVPSEITKKHSFGLNSFYKYCKWIEISAPCLTDDMREYILEMHKNGNIDKQKFVNRYSVSFKAFNDYVDIALRDGIEYINKKKETCDYIDSKDLFFSTFGRKTSAYDYFMYRLNHSVDECADYFGAGYETIIQLETYNNVYNDKLTDMFINGNYPLNYYEVNKDNWNICTKDDYVFISVDNDKEPTVEIYSSNKPKFPIGEFINIFDRENYDINTNGTPGVYYFRNRVDRKGYIGYATNLYITVSNHISMLMHKNSFLKLDIDAQKENGVVQFYRDLWNFDLNDIEVAIIYEIDNPLDYSPQDIEKTLYQKHLEFIEQYDTIKNGYNGYSKSNNIIYCYDTKTKKRFCCSSSVALGKVINKRIVTRQYTNDTTLLCFDRYIISRSVDNLEDKIETYYRHCDPNGVYHVEYISNEVIEEIFKCTSIRDIKTKFGIGETTILKYRKYFNITVPILTDDMREFILSERDNEHEITTKDVANKYALTTNIAEKYLITTLKDGWSYVKEKKENGTYINSKDFFIVLSHRIVSAYDYFIARLDKSHVEVMKQFNLNRDTAKLYESFNSLNYSRLHSLYIEKKYPYNYWVSESLERKSKIDYEVLDDCTDDCTDECIA